MSTNGNEAQPKDWDKVLDLLSGLIRPHRARDRRPKGYGVTW